MYIYVYICVCNIYASMFSFQKNWRNAALLCYPQSNIQAGSKTPSKTKIHFSNITSLGPKSIFLSPSTTLQDHRGHFGG